MTSRKPTCNNADDKPAEIKVDTFARRRLENPKEEDILVDKMDRADETITLDEKMAAWFAKADLQKDNDNVRGEHAKAFKKKNNIGCGFEKAQVVESPEYKADGTVLDTNSLDSMWQCTSNSRGDAVTTKPRHLKLVKRDYFQGVTLFSEPKKNSADGIKTAFGAMKKNFNAFHADKTKANQRPLAVQLDYKDDFLRQDSEGESPYMQYYHGRPAGANSLTNMRATLTALQEEALAAELGNVKIANRGRLVLQSDFDDDFPEQDNEVLGKKTKTKIDCPYLTITHGRPAGAGSLINMRATLTALQEEAMAGESGSGKINKQNDARHRQQFYKKL